MKKLSNNKKGFTLIELLAVIVILAIIVTLAIPAVTKYLTSARTSTFVDNAKSAISAVRNDVIINSKGSTVYYIEPQSASDTSTTINDLLEKQLKQSSFGADYKKSSCIKVTQTSQNATGSTTQRDYSYKYEMCLIDEKGNGFTLLEESAINEAAINVGTLTGSTCSCN